MTNKYKCGGCGNDTYTLEMAQYAHTVDFTEIRLQCTQCKSVAFFKPIAVFEMDWSGEGGPTKSSQ